MGVLAALSECIQSVHMCESIAPATLCCLRYPCVKPVQMVLSFPIVACVMWLCLQYHKYMFYRELNRVAPLSLYSASSSSPPPAHQHTEEVKAPLLTDLSSEGHEQDIRTDSVTESKSSGASVIRLLPTRVFTDQDDLKEVPYTHGWHGPSCGVVRLGNGVSVCWRVPALQEWRVRLLFPPHACACIQSVRPRCVGDQGKPVRRQRGVMPLSRSCCTCVFL